MGKEALANRKENRIKRINLTPNFILDLLKVGENGVVVDGRKISCIESCIPDTAEAMHGGVDIYGYITLTIQDDSFEEVEEGELIPLLCPVYRTEEIT